MVTNLCKPAEESPEIQRKEVNDYVSEELRDGDTWYLVESEWYHKFKQFIGLEEPDGMACHPGPINNSDLVDEKGELKKGLLENDHFQIIHENLWRKLCSWYGVEKNQRPLERKVVSSGKFCKVQSVEIYPRELKVACCDNVTEFVKHKFSRTDAIEKISEFARKHFNIPSDSKVRLLTSFKEDGTSFDQISENSTVEDETLNDDQLVLVDYKSAGENWKYSVDSQPSSSYTYRCDRKDVKTPKRTPGLCGLTNLGNTCFMNSVLQCMSNCPPITKYFLEDEHLNELNDTNPLGMKGLIAKTFGELIKTMWSGDNNYTAPSNFKIQVGRFAPQFCGYQQHDAQELLTFLLDGLHEDLNRVKKKPYIELKDADDRPDKIVAKESWDNYLKRNDSIIVDYCHGLLKSHVTCPQCECVSTTFDPFCYLSLPLPPKKNYFIQIKYIPYDQSEKEVLYKLCIVRNSVIRDICVDLIAFAKLKINLNQLIVAKVSRSHIHKFFALDDIVEELVERDNMLYMYDLPIPSDNTAYNIIQVCLWEILENDPKFNKNELIGDPILVAFPNKELTYPEIFYIISKQLSRHFTVPINDSAMSVDNEVNIAHFSEYVSIHEVSSNLTGNVVKLKSNESYVLNFKEKLLAVQLESSILKGYRKEVNFERTDVTEQRNRLKHSLDDCLSLFATNEKLGSEDAWYCPKCRKFQQATKKFDLWTVPKVLIIHLKRFQYTRYRRDKIDTIVEFPVYDLDISRFVINKAEPLKKYDLVGVCNHYGTLGGGHYTAFCKNNIDKNWYVFDDSSVRKVSENEVVSNCAYVLMYIQQD